jgi:inward rectifier potassium channel
LVLDAAAKLNLLLTVTTAEGKPFRRAHELRLERAHIPVFPLTWTLMHVMDEHSPLYGFDAAQVVAAGAQLLVTLEARDPMLATTVYEIRNYAPEDIRFGTRYVDAITTDESGMTMADLTKIGEMEPDVGERPEQGWGDREEVPE